MRPKRRSQSNESYWAQVSIALSQVTFGVAWAALFLPLDIPRMVIILANLTITGILILLGYLAKKRK